ncbi:MAG: hypothetical protein ACRD3S_04205, partial [Terracidiphilus sp.]
MKTFVGFVLCGLLILPAVSIRGQEFYVLSGYVTRVASNSDFDVNGIRVICGPGTQTTVHPVSGDASSNSGCPQDAPYLGERAKASGSPSKKQATLEATRIEIAPVPLGSVEGSAVIDALSASSPEEASSGKLLVRADGRRILFDSKSSITLIPPLHSLIDVKAGDWIEYAGSFSPDAVVQAKKVRISPAVVTKAEAEARTDMVRIIAIPDPDQPDTAAVKYITLDEHPASFYDDPAMQARVDAIMKKLIPAFQRDLPDSDPRKIRFRFQITADKPWNRVVVLPKGVILIPHQVIERMQNDSQVAAILADGIAYNMENEAFRMRAVVPVVATASYASFVYFDPFIAWSLTDTAKKVVEQIR